MLVQWQSKNNISLEALEEILEIVGLVGLPENNSLPLTIFKFHSLIGLNLDIFEEHVCVNECHLFPKVPKVAWKDFLDEKCPHCQTERFQVQHNNISPRKKFFRIPLGFQLENLTKLSAFHTSLEKMKAEINAGLTENESFWGARIATEICEEESILDDFMHSFLLSLGLDGVNCFKGNEYSVWPVAWKIWNLHPEERTSRAFTLLSCVIPGIFLHL